MSVMPASSSPIVPDPGAGAVSAARASTTSASADAAVHRTSGAGAATVGGRRVRFSEAVLREVLGSYGLQDQAALLEAALRLDDGNHYLKRSELEKAAESLTASGGATAPTTPTTTPAPPPTRPGPLAAYRWSEGVVSRVLDAHGLNDRVALLLLAVSREDGNRYLNRAELEAAAKVLTGQADEIGIVSDIDRTVMPPEEPGVAHVPYPGVAALYHALELGGGGHPGDTSYVTARAPAQAGAAAPWLRAHGLPSGAISANETGSLRASTAEKIRDVAAILEAHPGQRFVLFGDTRYRDPEVYQEIRRRFPDQVAAVVMHKVTRTVRPDRVDGMHLVEDYADAAAALLEDGLLDEPTARAIMTAAQREGLEITDREIDALLASHQPPARARATAAVDRIEGDRAILELEAGVMAELPASLLPHGTGEGSVLAVTLEAATGPGGAGSHTAQITAVTAGEATLTLPGGEEITLPADRLPTGPGPGDPVTLTLRHDVNEEARRKAEITSRLLGLRSGSPPDPGGTIIL